MGRYSPLCSFVAAGALLSLFLCTSIEAQPEDPAEFFEMSVRPLLADRCFTCHTASAMGGLEMKSREGLLKGGDSGPAIVPGHPEQSLLIQAVRQTHDRLKMPPQSKLEDDQIENLVTWIRAGAVWPNDAPAPGAARKEGRYVIRPEQRSFWSFQPPGPVDIPPVKKQGWVRSPIDHFVLSRLENKGLDPVEPADRRTLLRRAYFDLIGLPPTPDAVSAFLEDKSPEAFQRVVDRLLSSSRYGERWGRFWLDLARYSDDKLNSTEDEPYLNAFRYRNWIIDAFNRDLPYDQFVKAQLAGDLLDGQGENYVGGLGFYALSPQFQDDRVDATTKTFLGLTGGCAQCHDHKFDPIPTEDYYALLGVFNSAKIDEHPLSSEGVVKQYQEKEERLKTETDGLAEFRANQRNRLIEAFAHQTSRYIQASWRILSSKQSQELDRVAQQQKLDLETLKGWVKYLSESPRDHPFLDQWDQALASGSTPDQIEEIALSVENLVISVIRDKREVDEENERRTHGKSRVEIGKTELLSLERDKYFLWRDLAFDKEFTAPIKFENGILYYGEDKIDRFLEGVWRTHLDTLRSRVEKLEAAMPEKYPFYHVISDKEKPTNERVRIRGNPNNLGEEVPRRFLTILSQSEPQPFTQGSGRLELAEAIASPHNPLTARVMVNRIWLHHFGQGIVRTPSNLGRMGDRPSHPQLLDYLALRFVENGWSIKAMHREIMLSATYALSSRFSEANYRVDSESRLLWRYRPRRLDAEALRDSVLQVAGKLDLEAGGVSVKLDDESNLRRTVYGFISRRHLDTMLGLFDFPNPNSSSPKRILTNTPLQGLFFLNSDLVARMSRALSQRLHQEAGAKSQARISLAYRLLFGRPPTPKEIQIGLSFVKHESDAWPRYAQTLLSSNEFLYIN